MIDNLHKMFCSPSFKLTDNILSSAVACMGKLKYIFIFLLYEPLPERSKTERSSDVLGPAPSAGAHTVFLLEREDLVTSLCPNEQVSTHITQPPNYR